MKLLLIDQGDAGDWLANHLDALGFIPERAGSVGQAIRDGMAKNVMAVIADAGFLGQSAENVVRPLRLSGVNQPLMILSPLQDWHEMIDCLDAGADDYVVKPVRSDVIAARLRAMIRRHAGRASSRIVLDDIEIDLRSMCGWLSGQCLDLTRNEFRLLRLLLLCPDRVLSHEEIRGQLYRNADECSQNAVEVLVARLRRKVGKKRIVTIRGIGYRFKTGIVSTAPAVDELEPCHSSDKNGDGPADDLQAPQERQRSESSQHLWAYTI